MTDLLMLQSRPCILWLILSEHVGHPPDRPESPPKGRTLLLGRSSPPALAPARAGVQRCAAPWRPCSYHPPHLPDAMGNLGRQQRFFTKTGGLFLRDCYSRPMHVWALDG